MTPEIKRKAFFLFVIFSLILTALLTTIITLDILYGGSDGRLTHIYTIILEKLLK